MRNSGVSLLIGTLALKLLRQGVARELVCRVAQHDIFNRQINIEWLLLQEQAGRS